ATLADGRFTMAWPSETNAFSSVFYTVSTASQPNGSFTDIGDLIPATAPETLYTEPLGFASRFFRVKAGIAYTALSETNAYESWDASRTARLDARGYVGAVFDGHFIYFVPYQDTNVHGRVLRFDTTGDFAISSSWQVFDAGLTPGLDAKGYEGGV